MLYGVEESKAVIGKTDEEKEGRKDPCLPTAAAASMAYVLEPPRVIDA